MIGETAAGAGWRYHLIEKLVARGGDRHVLERLEPSDFLLLCEIIQHEDDDG
jgi:hypothetical protein